MDDIWERFYLPGEDRPIFRIADREVSLRQEFEELRRLGPKMSMAQYKRMQRIEKLLDRMPCDGVNNNICVAKGCYDETCVKEYDAPTQDTS